MSDDMKRPDTADEQSNARHNVFLRQAFYNGAYKAWFDLKIQETKFYMWCSAGWLGVLVVMIPEILKFRDIPGFFGFYTFYLFGISGFFLSVIICGIIFKLNADVINEELKNNHHKSIAWIDRTLYLVFYYALTSTAGFFIALLLFKLLKDKSGAMI